MRTTTTLIALSALLGLTSGARAQTPFEGPEGAYLGLEQRFNHLQWHATHNSYQRDGCSFFDPTVSLTQQLDRYDAWCIELDLRWDEDDGDFEIAHSCWDAPCGRNSLDAYLDQIAATQRVQDGFTLIDFETGEIGPCVAYPSLVPKPSGWEFLLRSNLEARFGDAVYTVWEFENVDDMKWPSVQELMRRGKHLAFKTGSASDAANYFFQSQHYELNTDDETEVITLARLDDDRFARHYPNGTDCSSESEAQYDLALQNGFTFAATNCSDRTEFRHHPPVPSYVNLIFGSSTARGTWLDPLAGSAGLETVFVHSAIHAYFKEPSMLVASIQGGVYDVTPSGANTLGGPLSINLPPFVSFVAPAPVRLTARNGQMVTLH